MRKPLKARVKELPSLDETIRKDLKNPKFAEAYRRAQLRVAIARAIKTAREKAGFTQGELAVALGLTQPMIGRLESLKDRSLPSLELLARISVVTKRRLVVDQPGIHFELVAND
jgi:DNA-binding XRE family transcriptional regulator